MTPIQRKHFLLDLGIGPSYISRQAKKRGKTISAQYLSFIINEMGNRWGYKFRPVILSIIKEAAEIKNISVDRASKFFDDGKPKRSKKTTHASTMIRSHKRARMPQEERA